MTFAKNTKKKNALAAERQQLTGVIFAVSLSAGFRSAMIALGQRIQAHRGYGVSLITYT